MNLCTSEPLKEALTERPRASFGHCPFCGRPTYGASCAGHRDLLALDPIYDRRPRLNLGEESAAGGRQERS